MLEIPTTVQYTVQRRKGGSRVSLIPPSTENGAFTQPSIGTRQPKFEGIRRNSRTFEEGLLEVLPLKLVLQALLSQPSSHNPFATLANPVTTPQKTPARVSL